MIIAKRVCEWLHHNVTCTYPVILAWAISAVVGLITSFESSTDRIAFKVEHICIGVWMVCSACILFNCIYERYGDEEINAQRKIRKLSQAIKRAKYEKEQRDRMKGYKHEIDKLEREYRQLTYKEKQFGREAADIIDAL